MNEIQSTICEYILRDFVPGARREELTDSTPLITGGILDSIATMQLVHFLEEEFGIELQTFEINIDHLNTVADIAGLVQSKMEQARVG